MHVVGCVNSHSRGAGNCKVSRRLALKKKDGQDDKIPNLAHDDIKLNSCNCPLQSRTADPVKQNLVYENMHLFIIWRTIN